MSSHTALPTQAKVKRSRLPGVIALFCGTAMIIIALLMIVVGVLSDFDGARSKAADGEIQITPSEQTVHLDRGSYQVYEFVGHQSESSTNTWAPRLKPGDVVITGGSGDVSTASIDPESYRLVWNQSVYTAVVAFEVTKPGDYSVKVSGPSETRFFVAPHAGGLLTKVAVGLLLGALGGFFVIFGFVVTIVGWRSRGTAVATSLAPAGWYDDPQRPGESRWWDGHNWAR